MIGNIEFGVWFFIWVIWQWARLSRHDGRVVGCGVCCGGQWCLLILWAFCWFVVGLLIEKASTREIEGEQMEEQGLPRLGFL